MNDKKPSEKEKSLDSLESTKEWIIRKFWLILPQWSRILIALIVIIGTPVLSTQSYWLPYVKDLLFKPVPRHFFRGYIYSELNNPLQTTVTLIDENGVKLTEEDSDQRGFITFNIPDDKKIVAFSVLYEGNRQNIQVNDDNLKDSDKFILIMSERKIKWQKD